MLRSFAYFAAFPGILTHAEGDQCRLTALMVQ